MRPSFPLGIEWEYQTVDPITRNLRSHIECEILNLARGHALLLRAGATHPSADWRAQDIYPDPHYRLEHPS